MASGNDLITAKDNYKPGDTVNLTVYRDGKTITVKLTLEESTPEKQPNRTKPRRNMKNSSSNSCSKSSSKAAAAGPSAALGTDSIHCVFNNKIASPNYLGRPFDQGRPRWHFYGRG